jgi:hypothetical protein
MIAINGSSIPTGLTMRACWPKWCISTGSLKPSLRRAPAGPDAAAAAPVRKKADSDFGLRPNWNVGMMEHWKNGFGILQLWVNGPRRRNDKI